MSKALQWSETTIEREKQMALDQINQLTEDLRNMYNQIVRDQRPEGVGIGGTMYLARDAATVERHVAMWLLANESKIMTGRED